MSHLLQRHASSDGDLHDARVQVGVQCLGALRAPCILDFLQRALRHLKSLVRGTQAGCVRTAHQRAPSCAFRGRSARGPHARAHAAGFCAPASSLSEGQMAATDHHATVAMVACAPLRSGAGRVAVAELRDGRRAARAAGRRGVILHWAHQCAPSRETHARTRTAPSRASLSRHSLHPLRRRPATTVALPARAGARAWLGPSTGHV